MARKFRQYKQLDNITVHLQNMPTYYVKYVKGLKHKERVVRVVATEERNVNVSKKVTMEHCFKEEGKQEITKKRKTQSWFLCTFKDRKIVHKPGRFFCTSPNSYETPPRMFLRVQNLKFWGAFKNIIHCTMLFRLLKLKLKKKYCLEIFF